MHNYWFLNFFKWCMNLTQSDTFSESTWRMHESSWQMQMVRSGDIGKLNHWVKSTYFVFSVQKHTDVTWAREWRYVWFTNRLEYAESLLSVHSHTHSLLPVALKPNTVFRIGLAYLNKFDNNSFIIALAFPFLAID